MPFPAHLLLHAQHLLFQFEAGTHARPQSARVLEQEEVDLGGRRAQTLSEESGWSERGVGGGQVHRAGGAARRALPLQRARLCAGLMLQASAPLFFLRFFLLEPHTQVVQWKKGRQFCSFAKLAGASTWFLCLLHSQWRKVNGSRGQPHACGPDGNRMRCAVSRDHIQKSLHSITYTQTHTRAKHPILSLQMVW